MIQVSSNLPTISNEDADKAKAQRMKAYRKGGDQSPCPFCHVPRFQRTDYVRCCVCGINWSPGEDLNRNPRMTGKLDQRRKTA